MAANTGIVYEDYSPCYNWDHAPGLDTLVIDLPGFGKKNLKIQVTVVRSLKISGQKEVVGNKSTRFQKEFTIPKDCNVDKIAAKFEDDRLYVELPKTPQQGIAETEKPEYEVEISFEKKEYEVETREANGHEIACGVLKLMGGLFGVVKQPGTLLNSVLMVLVLGLYTKNSIHTGFTCECKN